MHPRSPITRRRLLRDGGMTISLGAIVAACGNSGGEEPGRVGNAPPVTPPPTVEVDDAVLLRTATSLEYTAIEVYAAATGLGILDSAAQGLVDRFVSDHEDHAALTAELTAGAGGEPYECPNAFIMDRAIAPILVAIVGDESQGIAPSDDQVRDVLAVSNALETLAGATYQQLVAQLVDPELRRELALIGAQEVRHAAAVAMAATGTPEGYLSPTLFGEEVATDESGLLVAYAVSSPFGLLSPVELTVGARNDVGARMTFQLQTPADNSFVYAGSTCSV